MRVLAGMVLAIALGTACRPEPVREGPVPARTRRAAPPPSTKPSAGGMALSPAQPERPPPPAPPRFPVVVPVNPVQGRVTVVNARLRFVIVDFAFSPLPALRAQLGLFRDHQRIGEVRISGPVNGTSVVADVVSGEAEVGDLVREE